MSKPLHIVTQPLEINFNTLDDLAEEKIKVYDALNEAMHAMSRKHPGYRIVSPAFLRYHPWREHVKGNEGVDQLVVYSDVPTDGFRFTLADEDSFAREHQNRLLLLERVD